MKRFVKEEKGITLIALIITIIVMLILVGVTINVALNGGLFDKAKTASDQTQRETDREQLISAVIGTLNDDGTVNLTNLQSHLPEGFVYTNGVYINTVTGKEYTVNATTGKVEEYTEETPAGNTSPVAGTYNAYIVNNAPVTSIVLNNDGTGSAEVGGSTQTITQYAYDSTQRTITVTIGGNPTPFNYRTANGNKIMMLIGGGMLIILTTDGSTGITPIPANTVYLGTYNEKTTTFTFKAGGTFEKSIDGGEAVDYKYCIIDNEIMWLEGGNWLSMPINTNLEQIGSGANVLTKQ